MITDVYLGVLENRPFSLAYYNIEAAKKAFVLCMITNQYFSPVILRTGLKSLI